MAVKEDDYVQKTYYKVYKGKVVREWYQDEAPSGFLGENGILNPKHYKRITEESKRTVWYKNYIFSGVLTAVYEKKNDRINAYQFHVEIDGDSVLIVNSGSGYHKSFLLAMANIPVGQEITFSPYNFKDRESGKQVIGMTVKDNEGIKIPYSYTKDEPNGLPQPTKNKKGEWNWTKQEDFLDKKFDQWHKSYFKQVSDMEVTDAEQVEAKDDVPF